MVRTHLYKENQRVVMGIQFYAFTDLFSEKRANGFGKGHRNLQHTQIHSETNSLGIKQNS